MSFNGVVPAESCLSKIPPLQNPVFIADLHLAADKPATKEAFFKFLKNDAARFSELVILGDLFEFWAGDDHAPAYADILEALKAFFLNGHRIYVMHGNRDFLLGKGFTAATGAQLIADPIPVQVGFDHILLSHGDMWCTLDPEYQQFRATLRSPDVQRQILGEKLEHRIALAGGLRNQSAYDNQEKSKEVMDVVVNDVARSVRQYRTKIINIGHTHRPAHHTHVNEDSRFDRWVLPDWDFENGRSRGGYLSFENGYIHFGHLD